MDVENFTIWGGPDCYAYDFVCCTYGAWLGESGCLVELFGWGGGLEESVLRVE